MKNNTILDIIELNKKNNNKFDDIYKTKINDINKANKDFNCSLSQLDFHHIENKTSILNGVYYSLKDNIATKNYTTTGGSLFLKNYKPQYNAHVKTLLDNAGAICISKDNLDEFGLGGTGTFSAFGIVCNARDKTRLSGGSSSGSIVMVASNIVPFSIATDTGDSIRKPASYQGVVGFKPSYGAISRYGVFPYSPSLDHVGIIANCVNDIAIVFGVVAKQDNKDMTSIDLEDDYYKSLNQNFDANKLKICFLKDAFDEMFEPDKTEFEKYINWLKKQIKIENVNFGLDLLKLISPIYQSISYGEASSCWANLTGILFGESDDGKNFVSITTNSRTKFFGKELKRRFVIGSFITTKDNFNTIFIKSKKVRRLIVDRINEIFNEYDVVLIPGASSIAPLIDDVLKNKIGPEICSDALQIANFSGCPSITIPAIEINKMPLGININCKYKNDKLLLQFAKYLESINGGYND